MSNILGLSFYYHDSAACLVRDGEVIAAIAEERLNRKKHSSDFPARAIDYCLEYGELDSLNNLDAIVFYEKPLNKLTRAIETYISTWPRSIGSFVQGFPNFAQSKVNIKKTFRENFPNYDGEILFADHHLSHAASAFFPSPFEEAAILTIDGVGEWDTTCIGVGRGNQIELEESISFPHSIGLLYSALTAYLGFHVNDGEWKVMGLAPYGEPKLVKEFQELVRIFDDGSYALNMEYFDFHRSTAVPYNEKKWDRLFGFGPRQGEQSIDQEYKDLARSGQQVVEQIILNIAARVKSKYGLTNLVVAGGVGLNSVANWKIESSIFDNVWIQPAAGDDGGALGAALYVSNGILSEKRYPLEHAYLGPEYSDEEIERVLDYREVGYERLENAEMVTRAANQIARGDVVGWFQGRSEFGPRALGNRSILGDATRQDAKAKINSTVKFREFFRPFAPVVPRDKAHIYFDVKEGADFPFMLKVPNVRPEFTEVLPAITHEDGTGRVQTITNAQNPLFHSLVTKLGELTGHPVAVNTSFNVRGEPMVCSPDDALSCFQNSGLDALYIGSFRIAKTEAEKERFDSESLYSASDQLEAQLNQRKQANQEFVDESSHIQGVEDVLAFYKQMPFNYYGSALDSFKTLSKTNQIKEYPDVHRVLNTEEKLSILDVGCGAGWFSNSCLNYYGHSITGLDFNPVALRQARAVSRYIDDPTRADFVQGDVFEYEPPKSFDLVNSIGALHHTADCELAVKRLSSWLEIGGYIHLGLYHLPSRRAFLKYFQDLKARNVSIEELYDRFNQLEFDVQDSVNRYSWFRDQVLHPHETQHTFLEVQEWLAGENVEIVSTSLTNFKRPRENDYMLERENEMEKLSIKRLDEKRYFPGFFTVLGVKNV